MTTDTAPWLDHAPEPKAVHEDWLRRVGLALKGAPFDQLVSTTRDGIALQPLYARAQNPGARALRASAGPWSIAQAMDHPDPHTANRLALDDLEGGADALVLVTRDSPAARGFGLIIETLGDLDTAFENVRLDLISIRLDAGLDGCRIARLFAQLVDRRKLDPASVAVDFGLDYLNTFAVRGALPRSLAAHGAEMARAAQDLARAGFISPAILAEARVFHAAGASEAQELGIVLAGAVETLRAFESAGMAFSAARENIAFLLTADADQFVTIAKFRALRRLAARLDAACGLDPRPVRLHAQTSWRMMSARDPHVNILRTTMAAFSAGLGGADAICVTPFPAALGLPDASARRLARNSQLILIEESHLAKVEDPAAGSGAYEALTEGLCEKAWACFQSIEAVGGLAAALRSGRVAQDISAMRAARAKDIATAKAPLTGTSEFADLAEAGVDVLLPAPGAPPPARGAAAVTCEALAARRDAEPFEHLRAQSDAQLAKTGHRPAVYLIKLGALADHSARAGFMRNFLSAGGIEAVELEDTAAPDTIPNDSLVCLCASDALYGERAAAAMAALRARGHMNIWLAGRPRDLLAQLTKAGVSEFIFAGCDRIALLTKAQAILNPKGGAS